MARTKEARASRSAEEQAAHVERCKRMRAFIRKASGLRSSQQDSQEQVFEGSETEPEDGVFSEPKPEQVIKIRAQTIGNAGRISWSGRLRGGGADVYLEGSWVRKNFKAYVPLRQEQPPRRFALHAHGTCLVSCRPFLQAVQAAGGHFKHVPTGRAQERVAAAMDGHWDGPEVLSAPGTSREVILTAECPVVVYRQGAADLCAAYGLASAVHEYGDTSGAATIAACARAALASEDAFGHVSKAVRTHAAGWSSVPVLGHDPLQNFINEPVNLQLVGSDGSGTHAVATLGGLIFDANEERALPLSRAALDRCIGAQLNGAHFSHVARAVRLVPGKSLRKHMRRESLSVRA